MGVRLRTWQQSRPEACRERINCTWMSPEAGGGDGTCERRFVECFEAETPEERQEERSTSREDLGADAKDDRAGGDANVCVDLHADAAKFGLGICSPLSTDVEPLLPQVSSDSCDSTMQTILRDKHFRGEFSASP
jgi:hypothetical protein